MSAKDPIQGSGAADSDASGAGIQGQDKAFSEVKREKAKLKEELDAVKAQLDEMKSLGMSKEDYIKKLKSDLDAKDKQYGDLNGMIVRGLKTSAFNKALGTTLANEDFYNLVDMERISYDETNRRVDLESAKALASDFVKKYPQLLGQAAPRMPNHAGTAEGAPAGKSIDQMSSTELQEHIIKLAQEGKLK